ncbi:MAG: Holliday junction branch migration protein RuvA [Muribaculaceae bacterium]|nr:Holliday junction branch migration protein RuvA [Muribaculaceae bacterium]
MIESIKGAITAINPAAVTVETAGGVGYLLNITLPTFTKLEHAAETRLLVHESIRDDAWVLYGFIDEDERELFRALVGVSGVGAGSARLILSAIPAADLRGVIAGGDAKRLKSVKGVGAKTAERIIVDLKDKIKADPSALLEQPAAVTTPAFDEALEALVILGFQRQASQKALKKLFDADPTLSVEGAVKKAMAMM